MRRYESKPINEWLAEERPREKMILKGINFLSDAELIAILLGNGTRKANAIELARQMVETFGNLSNLCSASISDLRKINGIGSAKAVRLMAAFEISRRKNSEEFRPTRITHSKSAAQYMTPKLQDLPSEEFHVLFLDRSNNVKAEKKLSDGGIAAAIMDPRIIFKEAVSQLACSIVMVHNHPSGNPAPSEQDKVITKRVKECGDILDIRLLDHIIVSRTGYFSFADNGFI